MDFIKEIESGESKTIEFKEKIPSNKSIAKSAISFSNTGGGKLFLGIADQGNIIGLPNDIDIISLEDQIAQLIYDNCSPIISFEIYTVNITEKYILVLEVKRGNSTPYYMKNKGVEHGTYVRIGATNRLANRQKIKELEIMSKNISFDQIVNFEYELEDLDLSSLEKEFNKFDKKLDKSKLENLGLIRENNGEFRPTNGLIIILGKFENCSIKCSKFRGTTMTEFLDKAEYNGDVFNQLDNTIEFIKKHINFGGKIEGLQRKDRFEIPLVAIREAIVNALVHRDYQNLGRDIKVGIYDDVLNIVSPGSLPMSITEKDLLNGRSEIRNKVIARVLKELNYIEIWGSGIKRIYDSCHEYELKEPKIKETGDSVDVELFRVKVSIGKKIVNTKFSYSDYIENFNFSNREKIILRYLDSHDKITSKDVLLMIDVKIRRARAILSEMEDKKI
jgi:ATP-dependent DNA helicase RecG